jgi:hypothetical protein
MKFLDDAAPRPNCSSSTSTEQAIPGSALRTGTASIVTATARQAAREHWQAGGKGDVTRRHYSLGTGERQVNRWRLVDFSTLVSIRKPCAWPAGVFRRAWGAGRPGSHVRKSLAFRNNRFAFVATAISVPRPSDKASRLDHTCCAGRRFASRPDHRLSLPVPQTATSGAIGRWC